MLTLDTDIDTYEISDEELGITRYLPSFTVRGIESLKELDRYIYGLEKLNYLNIKRILRLRTMREEIGKLIEPN